MRVLLLDVNCRYSSTGRIIYNLYEALNDGGNTAAIGYGRGPLVEGKNIYRFSPRWEIYYHALLARLTGRNGCFSPVATYRLVKLIQAFEPDVVHLNDMHGYFVNIYTLVRLLKQKKIKTVWTFHCEYMYTGKCGHAYECERWKESCGNCPQLKEYPKSILLDRTNRLFNEKKELFQEWKELTIVTPSEWLKERVRQSFLSSYRVEVVYNGVDTDVFRPVPDSRLRTELGIKGEKVILAVAPKLMSDKKGGKYVIEAASRMKESKVKFVLVGNSENKIVSHKNIIDVGEINDISLLAQYYSMADVFVLCSKRETFSMTTAEALCCGTPVVGFLSGAPETIAIEEYSTFVEYGNAEKLVEALEKEIGRNGKDAKDCIASIARSRYSNKNMYDRYSKIYES